MHCDCARDVVVMLLTNHLGEHKVINGLVGVNWKLRYKFPEGPDKPDADGTEYAIVDVLRADEDDEVLVPTGFGFPST